MTAAARSPRPGPRPRVGREDVVDAAVALGVERVTIAAVAAALGVAPGTLCRYVDGRDDLVAAALERVLATVPLPPAGDGWRAYLEAEAWTRWAVLTRYAGLIAHHRDRLTQVSVRRLGQLVDGLTGLGFSPGAALLAADTVLDLVDDAATQVARLRGAEDTLLDLAAPPLRAPLAAVLADPVAHVRGKLALVLDGVAAGLAP